MLSVQGIIKDIKDKNRKNKNKGKAEIEINVTTVITQGKKNIESHKKEYWLYKKVGRDDGRFIDSESLYRTRTGHSIFKQVEGWLNKISSSPVNNNIISFTGRAKRLISSGEISIISSNGKDFVFNYR